MLRLEEGTLELNLRKAGAQMKGTLGGGNGLSPGRSCARPYTCREQTAAGTSRGLGCTVGERKAPSGEAGSGQTPGEVAPQNLDGSGCVFARGPTLNMKQALGEHGAPTLGEGLLSTCEKGHLSIAQGASSRPQGSEVPACGTGVHL